MAGMSNERRQPHPLYINVVASLGAHLACPANPDVEETKCRVGGPPLHLPIFIIFVQSVTWSFQIWVKIGQTYVILAEPLLSWDVRLSPGTGN